MPVNQPKNPTFSAIFPDGKTPEIPPFPAPYTFGMGPSRKDFPLLLSFPPGVLFPPQIPFPPPTDSPHLSTTSHTNHANLKPIRCSNPPPPHNLPSSFLT